MNVLTNNEASSEQNEKSSSKCWFVFLCSAVVFGINNEHTKKYKIEVKILGVTQAIEMEINVVNHDKSEHFYYRKVLDNELFLRNRSFQSFCGFEKAFMVSEILFTIYVIIVFLLLKLRSFKRIFRKSELF